MKHQLAFSFLIIISLVLNFSVSQSLRKIENNKVDYNIELTKSIADSLEPILKTKSKNKLKTKEKFFCLSLFVPSSLKTSKKLFVLAAHEDTFNSFRSASGIYDFTSDSGPPKV